MKNDTEQMSFENIEADNGPVVCLGMTFDNEEARREYFRNELRKKLPELKKIEGFPIGEDEDIIALSDPPYYTACPNPWFKEFLEFSEGIKVDSECERYNREPFVVDVAEGKYDKSYKFHPYATKVPHKAIMRYILHYTEPGDVVLDFFSGTGMTGVAAQYCNSPKEIETLGYKVDNGVVYSEQEEENGEKLQVAFSKVGKRKVFLNDLSIAGSFISYNFNHKDKDMKKLRRVLEKVKRETEWMFNTLHNPKLDEIQNTIEYLPSSLEEEINFDKSLKFGTINFVAWSDVFICPNCTNELVYWDTAVEENTGIIHKEFVCPNCNVVLTKDSMEKSWEEKYDPYLNKVIKQIKQLPVLINYTYGNKRYTKKPDKFDIELQKLVDTFASKTKVPLYELPDGDETNRPKKVGITHAHQFYTNRNLIVLSKFLNSGDIREVGKIVTRVASRITKMYGLTYQSGKWGAGGGPLSGTFYIPSLVKELNMIKQLSKSIETQESKGWIYSPNEVIQSVSSSTNLKLLENNSVDYIFVDPPFGGNLMYSELNFLWESWLGVHTQNREEAIVSLKQRKGIDEYKRLMVDSFKEAFRVLKPGRWITVEFSNTKASIWNIIQNSISEAGFIIANVAALDKKKGSFKAITTTTAVKQDLIITAYKPDKELKDYVKEGESTSESAWMFITQHLEKLPVFTGKRGEARLIAERTPRILFDRMVAYHVQNSLSVPISSSEFQSEVIQRYPMRDGMAFLDSQVAEYDKKRTLFKEFAQLSLFVSDENSAIEWIRQQLLKKPQTRQDLHPNFMREIQHISKHELLPELDDLLYQNFLRYDGDEKVPDQIASYLRKNYKDLRGLEAHDSLLIDRAMNRWYVPDPNKQADLEKLREKSLLREFDSYIEEMESSKKKLKQFRTEAIRAGFKKAYSEKDFEKIVKVGDRLPESVIQEDDKLLMYFDNACIRLGI